MRNTLTQILSIAIVLLVAVIIQSVATLSLTDLGTYDNSPKKQKEVINANNALIENAVNANLGYFTAQVDSGAGAVVETGYTPRYIGDVLVGTVSNQAWIAHGVTTNDWIQVSN